MPLNTLLYRLRVTAPSGGAAVVNIYQPDGVTAAAAYTDSTGVTAVTFPYTVAAGGNGDFYVQNQQLVVSAKVAGIELAGGQNTRFSDWIDNARTLTLANPVLYASQFSALGNAGTSATVSYTENAQYQSFTLNQPACNLTLPAAQAGAVLTLFITQDATGGRLPVWPSNTSGSWPWINTAANAQTIVQLLSLDGVNWTFVGTPGPPNSIDPLMVPGLVMHISAGAHALSDAATPTTMPDRTRLITTAGGVFSANVPNDLTGGTTKPTFKIDGAGSTTLPKPPWANRRPYLDHPSAVAASTSTFTGAPTTITSHCVLVSAFLESGNNGEIWKGTVTGGWRIGWQVAPSGLFLQDANATFHNSPAGVTAQSAHVWDVGSNAGTFSFLQDGVDLSAGWTGGAVAGPAAGVTAMTINGSSTTVQWQMPDFVVYGPVSGLWNVPRNDIRIKVARWMAANIAGVTV